MFVVSEQALMGEYANAWPLLDKIINLATIATAARTSRWCTTGVRSECRIR